MMAKSGSALIDLIDKENLADLLFTGKYFEKNVHKEIVPAVIATRNVELDIKVAQTNMSRVRIAEGFLYTVKLQTKFEPLKDAFKKDADLAEILLMRGNEKSAKGDIAASWRYYGLALLTTPDNGQLIGEIYGRRAALSFTLKDHKSCLKDLGKALKYDIEPKTKETMTKFHKKLVKICARPEDTSTPDYKDKMERKVYRDNTLFSIHGPPNPKIPVAAECVKIKYEKHVGRHLITTTDLVPGTTIIVEDAYVKVLKNCLLWDTQHCGACFKRSSCLIPCKCIFVMYCDDKCQLNGLKNGHVFECPCLPELHGFRTNWLLHLAFRTVCKVGPLELHALYVESKKNMLKMCHGEERGVNPSTGIYEKDSYYPISKLFPSPSNQELPELTVESIILAKVLNFNTNFFCAEPIGCGRNEFIKYVASRILLHATSFSVNSFGLFEKIGERPDPHESLKSNTADGTTSNNLSNVVYPFISLISHSCFPNAVCHHMNSGRMAVVTNRMIKSGEEITITYGYTYGMHELSFRRSALDKTHHFICYCLACCSRWPRSSCPYMSPKSAYLCPNCSGEFKYNLIAMARHCVLLETKRGGNGVCRNCKSEVDLTHLGNQAEKYMLKLSKAQKLVKTKKPLEAIPIIVDCIQFFQKTICPPSNRLLTATKLLDQAQGNVYRDLD